jgi:hypothetical protein
LDDGNAAHDYYIANESSPADDRTRVLKHGTSFAVFDRYGDIEAVGLKEQGIFREGTRFLSQLEFSRLRPALAVEFNHQGRQFTVRSRFGQRGHLAKRQSDCPARYITRAEN